MEVTSNQKPALLLAWVFQPIRDMWAQAFLRSQPLSLKSRGAPSNWFFFFFRERSKRNSSLSEPAGGVSLLGLKVGRYEVEGEEWSVNWQARGELEK